MARRFAPAAASFGAFLLSTALLAATTPKPVPVVGKATRTGVSAPARSLAPALRPVTGKEPPREEREIENEEIKRPLGPLGAGDRLDGALQSRVVSPTIPGPALTFEGLSADDGAAIFGFRVEPPDTVIDVGPDHVVLMVNSLFRVYDKTGAPETAIAPLSDLFAPIGGICGTMATGNDGDPIVLYDPLADRWLLSEFALPGFPGPPYYQCIAISQTADPGGAYYLYEFLMPEKINDYPHFGVWPDGYYMSDNQFNTSGTAYAGAGLFAFDRMKMLVGDPTASYIYFDYFAIDPNAGGMLPSDVDGIVPPPAGTPNFFMEWRADEFGDPLDALRVYEFHADFASPASSTLTVLPDIAIAAFDPRNPPGRGDIEEPVPGENLDAIADRLMHRLAYRTLAGGVQSFVVNWTVNVSGQNPTTPATYQAGIRFTELRRSAGTGAFSVQNQVTYSTDAGNGATGRNIWMGSAAQDNQGNSAVGFSASSTTLKPSIVWAGRLAGDPPDTLAQGEATMFTGTGVSVDAQNRARWGDYSAMSVDPADDCTFWYAQEYYANDGTFDWKTRIGNFTYAGCTSPQRGQVSGTVTDCLTASPIAGVLVTTPEGFVGITDASGQYAITAPPGNYSLTFSRGGYAGAVAGAAITNGGNTVIDLCLTPIAILGADGASLQSETCAPPNSALDPGESVVVRFCVENTGALATTDLVGTLLPSGGVGEPGLPLHFGVVAPGASVCQDFPFVVEETCGEVVLASIQLQDGATSYGTLTYDLQVGVLALTDSEDFDAVSPPTLPSGWIAANASGPPPLWVTSATAPFDAPNDAFIDDPAVVSDKRLDSAPFAVTAPNAMVTFRNNYDLEEEPSVPTLGYDGGVLEISIDGGPFQDILAAGGSFVSGGYNTIISSDFSNPIGGRQAWSGPAGGYILTSVLLPASAAGQNVVLRWRMGSDDSFSNPGWRIDDIQVMGAHVCCSLPVGTALSVDEHPSSGSSNQNAVFEPGEQVVVAPTWMNGGSTATFTLSGVASGYTGPPGATYTLNDSSAAYGTLAALTAVDCFTAGGDCYQMSVDDPAIRPAPHWDASFSETPNQSLVGGGLPAKTWTLHIAASFADVPTSNQFYRFIETIFHNGVTGGCGGANYCPGNPALRKQMAVFLLKSKEGPLYVPPPAVGIFADVPPADPFAPWIEELYNRGVTGGCSASPLNYCPDNTVLRQQMAVFLLKTLEGGSYTPPACTVATFTDVPCSNPFSIWIYELVARAITAGCGGTNFCPTNPNTRGQMAVFLAKTFGLRLYGP